METNERVMKEYQKIISKLFDKLNKKDEEIKELQKMINKLDKQTKVLGKLMDKFFKEVGNE